jgi:hypothetical protein
MIVSNALRTRALQLATKKLKGDRLLQTHLFIQNKSRLVPDIERLIRRLEPLPDTERDAPRFAVISDAQVNQLRADRAAGATIQKLATQYGISTYKVTRICKDTPRGEQQAVTQ